MKDPLDHQAAFMISAALAFCGRPGDPEKLWDAVARRSPTDTLVNGAELPVGRAAVELNRGNSAHALQLLQSASPYGPVMNWLPYFRGLTLLHEKKGAEAAADFESVAGRKGFNPLWPGHELAYLGLGRAYALAGDAARSRKAYEDFFAAWKDGDPEIPVLKEAKAEYAKLK